MPDTSAWKRSLLTLKDEPFFDLVRNYLGKIQTPFHKPTIIDSLERFLLKPETRARMILLLDREEIAVAGFVLRAGGIDFDSLYSYFRDEYTLLRFMSLTDNLVERLILYRDEDDLLRVNPLMSAPLEEIAAPSPVESRPVEEETHEPWLSEELLVAFLALVKEIGGYTRQDGELKKSAVSLIEERIPVAAGPQRCRLLFETAAALTVADDVGGELQLQPERIERFLNLPHDERRLALWSAVAAGAWEELKRADAYRAGRLTVLSLRENLRTDRGYRAEAIIRQITDSLAADHRELNALRLEKAFERLVTAGLLARLGDFIVPLFPDPPPDGETVERPLILQPTFEILMPPETGRAGLAFCILYCRLVRFDRVVNFEIDRELFLTHLKSHGAPEDLIDTLTAACGGTAPQNVIMTITGWMEESRQIEITTGTVVKVADEMIGIVEERFSDLILQTLAPGVYFVRPEKISPLLTRWRSLGYGDPGEIRNLLASGEKTPPPDYTPRLHIPTIPTVVGEENGDEGDGDDANRRRLKEELLDRLEEESLTDEQQRELEAKIEKKIFLFPDQVGPEACRIGRIEARGLDFHAKLRIIEDVLVSRDDLLEIETPEAADGRVLVHPIALDKQPGNPTLKALVLPEEKVQNFLVRKAIRIRKRKRSLFY